MPEVTTIYYGFTTRFDGGGLLDPNDAFKSLFHRGKAPGRGSIGVSVEEGLLRSIAADAAGGLDCALYDKTLSTPTPPVLGSSLIKLSGACLTL